MTSFVADTTALLARTPEVLRTLLIGLPRTSQTRRRAPPSE